MSKKSRLLSLLIISVFFLLASFNAYSALEEADHEISVKCGTFVPKKQQGLRFLSEPQFMREKGLQASYATSSGNFLIHYDTTGTHAVINVDLNKNGIPDYVDSTAYYMEYVYNIYINEIGYKKPLIDNGAGGSDAYDIYLIDIGNGPEYDTYYGWTTPEISITIPGKFQRAISYIVLDNNYSSEDITYRPGNPDTVRVKTYSTFGINGMKITAAHEFHHAVQFSYGEDPSGDIVHEMTSTYMEYRVFPEIKDYIGFVRKLFKSPSSYVFGIGSGYGYHYAILGQYFHKYYGDRLLLRTWELVGEGRRSLWAIDSALNEEGSSLPDAWCKFMTWIYYTGKRAVDGEYFTHAREFPEIKFVPDTLKYSHPSISLNGSLLPFEFRASRFIFPTSDPLNSSDDTVDMVITNPDLDNAIDHMDRSVYYSMVFTGEQQSGTQKIDGINYYFGLIPDIEGKLCYSMFVHPGRSLAKIAYAYPDPYKPALASEIMFPAPPSSLLYDNIELSIYTSEYVRVYNSILKVGVNNSNKVIIWNDIPSDLSSGVYIFEVKYKDEDGLVGKFMVIR